MNAKIQKLQDQFNEEKTDETLLEESTKCNIFNGISIYVNGYTDPPSDELKRIMMQNGGLYQHYYSKSAVTHIIANNLPDSKIKEIRDKKVVRPEWLTDSLKAGKLLSFVNYQLYTAQGGRQLGITSHLTDKSPEASSLEQSLHNTTSDTGIHNTSNTGIHIHTRERTIENKSTTSATTALAKAGSPSFVSEFYQNSRLHFLSTWGAEFRQFVNELQKQACGSHPGRQRLRDYIQSKDTISTNQESASIKGKVIMHIDMDCFFVSVGLLDRPELLGKPVAVTHSKGKSAQPRQGTDFSYEIAHYGKRALSKVSKSSHQSTNDLTEDIIDDDNNTDDIQSNPPSIKLDDKSMPFNSMAEIASCSYEARKSGVKNGMFMGRARELCPNLITIPYDFENYRLVSQKLYETVASYTHDIEAVSCDEMLVDCTDILTDTEARPHDFAHLLRKEIKDSTRCNASAGLAGNILMARMATRKAKPNGQVYLSQDDVLEYIKEQPVGDLPGVGWSIKAKLTSLNVASCGDLQALTLQTLTQEFGPKTGKTLYEYSRGRDDRSIKVDKERKSVSAEINYGIRFTKESEMNDFLSELAKEVANRLQKAKVKGKCITLKLKVRKADAPKETMKFLGHGVCDNIAKSVTIHTATDSDIVVGKECLHLLKQVKAIPEDLRGMGIQIHKLEDASQSVNKQGILQFTKPSTTQQMELKTQMSTHNPTPFRSLAPNHDLPPLPKLPSVSPAQRSISSLRMSLPSPSQIDPDVLKELPLDIRNQIEMELAKSAKQHGKIAVNEETPGCSHWRTNDSTVDSTVKKDLIKTDVIVPLPNMSQIDMSCLEALPLDMQDEIKAAYAKQQNDLKSGCNWLHSLGSPATKASPAKIRNPLQKSSPVFKVPKARPQRKNKQLTPKKLNYPQSKLPQNLIQEPATETVEAMESMLAVQHASLCGCVSLPDVKQLLSEWIESTSSPETQDLDDVNQYIIDLVVGRNLEYVNILLKFLKRHTNKIKSPDWSNGFNNILNNAQTIISNMYGCKLKWTN